MRKARERAGGFSLLEVTIAGVILVAIILIVFGILHESQSAANIGTATGSAEERGRLVLDTCKNELIYAKIVLSDFPADRSYIRYQVPNRTGALAYGYFDSSGTFHAGWSAILTFLPQRLYLEPAAAAPLPLPSQRLRVDINLNGNNADALAVGMIVREIYDGVAPGSTLMARIPVSNDVILNASTLNGDVNGDGVNDPLFELLDSTGTITIPSPATVRMVRVNVWHGLFATTLDQIYLRRNNQDVQLRNPQ
jgi:hypothetical protein